MCFLFFYTLKWDFTALGGWGQSVKQAIREKGSSCNNYPAYCNKCTVHGWRWRTVMANSKLLNLLEWIQNACLCSWLKKHHYHIFAPLKIHHLSYIHEKQLYMFFFTEDLRLSFGPWTLIFITITSVHLFVANKLTDKKPFWWTGYSP